MAETSGPQRLTRLATASPEAAASALDNDSQLLWDSGGIDSTDSTHRVYSGPRLRSRQRCSWRVRIWDDYGTPSEWSAPAWWEMGLLELSDWSAQWIEPDAPSQRVPYLRRRFALRDEVARARVYATSHGLYQLYLNGHRIGDFELTPGFTSYHKRLQYQTYDLTESLRIGDNVIGALLGEGWYAGVLGLGDAWDNKRYGEHTSFFAQLEVTYRDDTTDTIVTDEHWRSSPSPILNSGVYAGETYDARLEQTHWANLGGLNGLWSRVLARILPHDGLVAQHGPPIRKIQELVPKCILRASTGETIVDLGQNMVGWVRLCARGPAGTTITLRHGEILDAKGDLYTENLIGAGQTIRYILRGTGAIEVYEPHFTFQGFRYVSIHGYPGEVTVGSITGVVLHSDMAQASEFATSDDRLNQLHHNVVWSQKGNSVDIPTDCPQRLERLGWTGDAQVFAATAAFNMDVALFFTKWLKDLAADQYPNGSVPWVVPDVVRTIEVAPLPELLGKEAAGAAGWGDAATVIPWELYLAYGDTRVLQEQYASMAKWVDYQRARAGDQLVWSGDYQWGDWLPFGDVSTDTDLIATAYFARSVDLLGRTAQALGKDDDVLRYRILFRDVRAAFNRTFVATDAKVGGGTQTAYVLALQFDLLPPEQHAAAAGLLAASVRSTGHLTTGFLGTPGLLFALSKFGYLEDAYRLLLRDNIPSWLYPLTHGATTIWENWDGIRPDGSLQDPSMNSFNHYAKGAVGEWMYRVIAGISADSTRPGYKHSRISPKPGGGLHRVRASHSTLYGELSTSWEIAGSTFQLVVSIPANTTATVTLPSATVQAILESGEPLAVGNGITSVQDDGADVTVELGSGSYRFSYAMADSHSEP